MKRILLLLGIVALVGCTTMKPATSYHFTPNPNQVEDLGRVVYLIEKEGYSIITVENLVCPIYIQGTLPEMEIPTDYHAYLWEKPEGRYHFVWMHKRYFIDGEKTEL
jgi:hypothetical protein